MFPFKWQQPLGYGYACLIVSEPMDVGMEQQSVEKSWRESLTGRRIGQRVRTAGSFLLYLLRQFDRHQGKQNAAALTYTTLFAVVPMMTVTYAMLSSIPSFQGVSQQLEGLIFDNFIPSTGATVRDYLIQFASQARSLTAVGVGFLIVTAYMMLKTIETTFNNIWQVERSRTGIASFLLYWAVLSLGPLLLGLGFVLSSYVASLPLFSDATVVLGGRERVLSLLPLLLSSAAFTLIYAAVPNCRVPFRHALVGGIVVALLFEAAKRGFALFVSQFPSYELVYGAFAAVPMFLAWIYISWLIVLVGAELVRAQYSYRHRLQFMGSELLLALRLLESFWRAQRRGELSPEARLSEQWPEIPVSALLAMIERLVALNIVIRSESGGLLLRQDLSVLSVDELADRLDATLPEAEKRLNVAWVPELNRRLVSVSERRSQLLDIDLVSLFSYDKPAEIGVGADEAPRACESVS